MTVAKAEMPALTLKPWVLGASAANIFLYYALLWVATAGYIATVIGRLALGEVEGAPVLSALSSVTVYSLTSGLLLISVVLMLIAMHSVLNSTNAKDSKKDTEEPLKTPHQIMRKVLKDPLLIGAFVLTAFIMLVPAGDFLVLVGQSILKGSQMARVGSILRGVGILGANAAIWFIILPTTVLRLWRMK